MTKYLIQISIFLFTVFLPLHSQTDDHPVIFSINGSFYKPGGELTLEHHVSPTLSLLSAVGLNGLKQGEKSYTNLEFVSTFRRFLNKEEKGVALGMYVLLKRSWYSMVIDDLYWGTTYETTDLFYSGIGLNAGFRTDKRFFVEPNFSLGINFLFARDYSGMDPRYSNTFNDKLELEIRGAFRFGYKL